jgi:NADPH:quinone reductase-like Zn-dependent oxidoreductase
VIEADVPQPQAGKDELLIQVRAAGVIPTELSWYPTTHKKNGEPRTGAIPTHEFSGVVAGGDCFPAGLEVFGMNDWFADGAAAEFCVAPCAAVVAKPSTLSHTEAASVPISALTAWQGLFDRARLQKGERVLVHGGAGAVGMFVVQLARLHGARVTATASAGDASFVRDLGADVLDYRTTRFDQQLRDLDVVFDTVGGETLERSWAVLKPGGRMVTVVSTSEESRDPRVKQAFFIVEAKGEQLAAVADLLENGQLRTAVSAAVPLERAAEAFAGKAPKHAPGKLVIEIQVGS